MADDNLDNEGLQGMADNLRNASEVTSESLLELAKTAGAISGVKVNVDTTKLEKSFIQRTGEVLTGAYDAISPLTTGALKFYSSVGQGNQSFTALSTVMRGASQTFKKIPVVGETLNAAMEAMGPIADELLKELDSQRSAFHTLSQYGALTGEGMSNMQKEWLKSNMSLSNFTASVSKNSQTLALMRGSTSSGVSAFSDMMEDMLQGSDDRMRSLGMDQPAIAASTMSYLKIQTRLGQAQKRTTAELETGAKDYAIQLATLSKFSGKNIEELQQSIEEASADDRFNALYSMADDATKKLLDERTKLIATLPKEMQKGARDALAGAQTPEALKAINSLGPGIMDLSLTTDQARQSMLQNLEMQRENARNQTLFNSESQDVYFGFASIQTAHETLQGNLTEATDQTAKAASGLDKQTKNVIETEKAGEKIAINYKAELTKALPVMADVTKLAMKGMSRVGDELVHLGDTIEKLTGIHIPSPEEFYDSTKESMQKGLSAIEGAFGKGATGNEATKQAMAFFQSKGWTKEQAAGIVGNLQQESGNFSAAVISGQKKGDSGKAVGIAQWHADRQENFAKLFGHSLEGAPLQEQLEFINHELTQGSEKAAGAKIKQTTTASDAAAAVDKFYERSAGTERSQRMANAQQMMKELGVTSTTEQPTPEKQAAAPKPEEKTAEVTPEEVKQSKPEKTTGIEKTPATVVAEPVPTTKPEEPTDTTSPKPLEVPKQPAPVMTVIAPEETQMTSAPIQSKEYTPSLNLADFGITPTTTAPDTQESVKMLSSALGLENVFSAFGGTTPALGGPVETTGQTANQINGLMPKISSLFRNDVSELAAPKLPETTATPTAPQPSTGTAAPNDAAAAPDPNQAIAQMNQILNDIVSKLDALNSVGQRQVVATTDLGKAVQQP